MPKLKLLLDECLDRRLVQDIPNHFVKTVPEMGWSGLKNGELLEKAQKEFDIFITNDQNLSLQQNLPKFRIAVLVLCSASHKLNDLRTILLKALPQLNTLQSGQTTFIKN